MVCNDGRWLFKVDVRQWLMVGVWSSLGIEK